MRLLRLLCGLLLVGGELSDAVILESDAASEEEEEMPSMRDAAVSAVGALRRLENEAAEESFSAARAVKLDSFSAANAVKGAAANLESGALHASRAVTGAAADLESGALNAGRRLEHYSLHTSAKQELHDAFSAGSQLEADILKAPRAMKNAAVHTAKAVAKDALQAGHLLEEAAMHTLSLNDAALHHQERNAASSSAAKMPATIEAGANHHKKKGAHHAPATRRKTALDAIKEMDSMVDLQAQSTLEEANLSRHQCSGWAPESGTLNGKGDTCAHWGWATKWCWVEKDYNGAGHDAMVESGEYKGRFFVPCTPIFPAEIPAAQKSVLGLHSNLHSETSRFLTWAPVVVALGAFAVLASSLYWRSVHFKRPAPKHDPRGTAHWRPSLKPRRDSLHTESTGI